ncbi:hypothetical protein J2T08_001687 [Neorhizobium galegae]|uniref:hypothetical protein n=1 Tax=Neorhizobium galegae TaxID=399 RepID=UPI001AE7B1FA|nr:hypothetical protein [Neorhizobium galegae]MBP2562245.1 hypothetical protein [Neorhizobium galegae]MDQ0133769.1 hypothetical protein [Neorhizobium galegae]
MTTILTGLVAECFDASAATPIPGDIHQLVQEALERTMHQEATRQAVSGDSEGLAALGRSITVDEGRLLESIVVALARRNGDFAVLSGMKLPVSDAALALIERNSDEGTISSLSLDPEGRSRRHYHPDLVLANRRTSEAIVIDVKRSLGGYLGGSKLSELKNRMQAAGLVLPDILWRDHQRLAVKRVSVAIIDGSRTDTDVSDGIWSLARLDELTGVPGAGVIAQSATIAYRRGICDLWARAIRDAVGSAANHIVDSADKVKPAVTIDPPQAKRPRGRPRKTTAPLRTVTVGLFRPGTSAVH